MSDNAFRVAVSVSLPLIMPSLLFAAVLVFFLGFELFGLPLVLGDPEGILVLSTYLYKLTNKLGTPSYHLNVKRDLFARISIKSADGAD